MMSEKRFTMVIEDEKGNFHYFDKKTSEKIKSTLALENLLNEQEHRINMLRKQVNICEYQLRVQDRILKEVGE